MIDEVLDDAGDDEPATSRADLAALRMRLLAQRRASMWMDAYELGWFAHHVGKLIPEYRDHPLFLATLRAHWLSPSTVPARSDADAKEVDGLSAEAEVVVTSDPEELAADLPGLAQEIERTLKQHPWSGDKEQRPVVPPSFDGSAFASALLASRGFRRSKR